MKKRVVTLKKLSLHDETHNSFVFGLTGDELLKVMTAMTAQHYYDTHGRYPPRLDKTKISFRQLKE